MARLRIALAATLVLALTLVTVFTRAVVQAIGIRRSVSLTSAASLLTGDWPQTVVGRYVMLLPGAPLYHKDLHQVIAAAALSDTIWNRYIVGRFLAHSPTEELAVVAPWYQLLPSGELETRAITLLREGHFQVIPLLARTARGRAAITAWRTAQQPMLDADQADQAFPYLAAAGLPEFLPVAEAREKNLADQAMLLATFLFNAEGEVPSSLALGYVAFLAHALESGELTEEVQSFEADRTGDEFASYVDPESAPLIALIQWMLESEAMSAQTVPVLKQYLESSPPVSVGEYIYALGIVECEANSLGHEVSCGPGAASQVAGAESLYASALGRATQADPRTAATIYHAMAHLFPQRARTLAVEACAEADSSAAKSVTVLAERHSFQPQCLERVFSGSEPRVTLFRSVDAYAGLPAAEAYKALSGHSYTGVGKRWPPHYGARQPGAADAAGWEEFIETYPWYPGTDDAYYRLAYAHLLAGNGRAALEVVGRYKSLQYLPDRDSDPFIDYLELVARSEEGEDVSQEELARGLVALNSDRRRVPLELAMNALDWIVRHQNELSASSLPQADTLWRVRAMIERARVACSKSDLDPCEVPTAVSALLETAIAAPDRLRATQRVAFSLP